MQREISRLVSDFERGRLSRRQLIAHLSAVAAAMAGAPVLGQTGEPAPSTFRARSVDHVALRVTDVERSRRFYEQHLGLEVTNCGDDSCFLSCGDDFLALFRGGSAGLDHYAFAIDGFSASGAVAKLETAGLTPKRRQNRVYFDDPDGIEVQVIAGG